jgi:UMF1 family MFS transporter
VGAHDFRAAKKRFLFGSYLLTVAATALLYFVSPGQVLLGVVLVVISNYGFAVGESFTSSFLPDLGPTDELGKISGYAWGLGYVGGIACTAIVLGVIGDQTLENFERVRLVGPITALFFLVAAIPTFMFLRERGTAAALPPGESLLGMGFRLVQTGRALGRFRDLVFFGSFFFAMAGLSIVIAFAFIYGDQVIRWNATSQMLMFVITNLAASVGAVGFGFLQNRNMAGVQCSAS